MSAPLFPDWSRSVDADADAEAFAIVFDVPRPPVLVVACYYCWRHFNTKQRVFGNERDVQLAAESWMRSHGWTFNGHRWKCPICPTGRTS